MHEVVEPRQDPSSAPSKGSVLDKATEGIKFGQPDGGQPFVEGRMRDMAGDWAAAASRCSFGHREGVGQDGVHDFIQKRSALRCFRRGGGSSAPQGAILTMSDSWRPDLVVLPNSPQNDRSAIGISGATGGITGRSSG